MNWDNEVLWQPNGIRQLPNLALEIRINKEFARALYETQISPEATKLIQSTGQDLLERLGYKQSNPYLFIGETGLVDTMKLIGCSGTWLELNTTCGSPPRFDGKRPLVYYSKNLNKESDIVALIALFENYAIRYHSILKD